MMGEYLEAKISSNLTRWAETAMLEGCIEVWAREMRKHASAASHPILRRGITIIYLSPKRKRIRDYYSGALFFLWS